ncbi:MAG: methanogenesis marker 2 protein [Thermoplasmata archaeon]|nr:methanogenesis marker 2 protein [Thermoplasmata archaeon]
MVELNLTELIRELKSYLGITRKRFIADVVQGLPQIVEQMNDLEVLADFGEDAAVLAVGEERQNDNVFLLAADGIMESLMVADPYWAGYCSVLVNINDIAAMGGRPLAMVDVLSVKDTNVLSELTRGMNDACVKFGIPIVGGHVHPDSEYNAVDVTILGTAKRPGVIYSHTAEIGDSVVFAMDLDGSVHPNSKYSWDTTQHKSPEVVRRQVTVIEDLGKARLVHAGKDISNPGTIGTLGMLLETSKKGAIVDLTAIPWPGEDTIEFTHWLKVYQGCGFVVTCEPNNANEVINEFDAVGLTAKVAGEIISEQKLIIKYNDQQDVLFDFTCDKITGL